MNDEIISYLNWCKRPVPEILIPEIVDEKQSDLCIADADTDVIFQTERKPITKAEYLYQKELALKSAEDFYHLYNAIPDKRKTCLAKRKTFYGQIPTTAEEMYEHTKNVNSYYWGEIGVDTDNSGTILESRKRGFELLESIDNYLDNTIYTGRFNEEWSLRKVIRRFIWHDRIHAKAMYSMALKTFKQWP